MCYILYILYQEFIYYFLIYFFALIMLFGFVLFFVSNSINISFSFFTFPRID